MADKTFNDVKINLTLKPQTARANVSSNKEDLAVQMGKIQQWYPGLNNYATCETAAGTAIKTVDCPGFELTTGTVVIVKFTYSNTAASPKLNVNSTGAKSIYKYGTTVPGTTVAASWPAGSIVSFTYDGTSWIMNNHHDDTNTDTKVTQAYSTTDNTYPVLLSSVAGISSTASRGDQTSIVNNQIYANPSNGRLYAKIPEAFLFWGGKDFSGSYGPIDAAMIPTLSANRAAFYPGDRIVVEYTRDGGTTWLDYGADNTTKTALFTTGASFVVGKSTSSNIATPSCKLRITIKNTMGKLYSYIQKIAIYVSTGGSSGCTVDIKGRTRTNVEAESDTWANLKTAVPISGYSGWNILQTGFTTYGNSSNKSSQYDEIRFIFSITSHGSSAAGLSVSKIYMYGGVGWNTPSTLASTGLIYAYDASQNVVFPANITCGGTFIAKADVYSDALSSGALNMRNSDIYGCNSIKFADLCDNGAEGIQFYRDGTHADSFYGKSGKLYYHPNRAYGSTAGNVYTILHTGNLAITQSLTSGTKIGTITIDGTGTDLYAPSSTDTKVTQTAVGSTYTNYRPLVIGASNSATAGFSPSTVTDTTFTTQAIYCQPASGTIFATKFDGFLAPKLFTSSTIGSTAGSCFFYGNNLLGNANYDWIGIQGDSGSNKFQLMPYTGNMLLYRQNDNGGSSTAWQDWISLLSPSSVTANGGITATITTTTTGTDYGAVTFNSGVRLSHTNSVTAVTSNSLLKFKYDAQGHITGSTEVAASDLPSHTHPYLPLAGGTMDDSAEITIPNGSHSSQYTGFGTYHYIGAGNGWARGINVNSATDGTRIGSLGMYGNANATEPLYAYFGKTYNDAWYFLYKNIFRIQDAENSEFQFQYKPASLSSSYSGSFLSLYPGDTYGYGIVLGHSHGGLTVVGGGESGKAFVDTAFTSTTTPYGSTVFHFDSESLVLTADDSIWFLSGANGLTTSAHTDWTNVRTALFDSSGNFRPSVDNKGSIGTSSFKWASIHGTTIYENGTSLASKYAAINHTHDSLVSKALTKETLANTVGNFFFSGTSLLDNVSYDWIGIQAGNTADKWQMTSLESQPFIRQNDSGGTDATHWSDWKGLILPSSITGEKGITVTTTQTTLGSGDSAVSYDSGVKIGVGTSLTISGITRNTTVYGTDNPKLFFGNINESQNIELQFTDYDSIGSPASLTLVGNQGNEFFIAPQICAKTDAAAGTAASQNMTMTKFGLYSRSYRAGTSQNHAQYVLRTYDGKSNSANGQLMSICSGGLTIIGGGESAHTLANLIADDQTTSSAAKLTPIPDSISEGGSMIGDTENMIVSADQCIYFLSNCGTIANRSGWYINTLSNFVPLKTKTHDIGTTDHLVNNIYASNFIGYEPNQTTTTMSFNGIAIRLPSNTLSGWARGMLFEDNSGTRLGGIGFYGSGTTLNNVWIGKTYTDTWCIFKSTNIDVQVPVTRTVSNYTYIAARSNAIIYSNYAQEAANSHFYPALFSKSQSGGWAIGTLSNSNGLKFSYTTDADFNNNTNASKTYDISVDGRFSGSATKLYVSTNTATTGTTFRLLFAENTDSAGDRSVQNASGLYYYSKAGTTSAAGSSQITLGNSTATGSAGNRSGALAFYSSSTHYGTLAPLSLTATRSWSLPDETGEVMIRSTANSGNQPVLYASSVNYSTNPLDIEVTNIFTQWKVVYVVLERIIYSNGVDTAVSFQFLIPLQRVKALGTSPSNPYRIRVPYSDRNKLGEAYIDIKYVNASKFIASYSLGEAAGGMGIWTIYGIY